jgi:hypothetical protein
MDRLRATQTEFLGCLVHSILREAHKLLDIADRTLHIHGRNMEAEWGKVNGHHVLGMRHILPELLNVQRTTEHPKHVTVGSRSQRLVDIQRPVKIRQERMAVPTGHIGQGHVIVQVR